jgi:rhodanese-related sulfurtransferase
MDEVSGFKKLVDAAKSRIQEVHIEEFLERRNRGEHFCLIDIREDDEWRESRIPGAIHIGKGVIERDIESDVPDKAKSIVVYCGGGSRSALAAETLLRMGYANVESLIGGIRGWHSLGLPIEQESIK